MNSYFRIVPIALLVSYTFSARADLSNGTLRVSAFIDGKSRLVVTTNSVHWDHISFLQPGRSSERNDPTYIDNLPWIPQWPGAADEIVASSQLTAIAEFASNTVSLNIEMGRERVQIIQQPDETNGMTLIVEFDDSVTAGADWYTVLLEGVAIEFQAPLSISVACVDVSWLARSNRVYQLQYTTDLQSPVWVNIGPPIQGFGTNVSATDYILGSPHRFYRAIVLP